MLGEELTEDMQKAIKKAEKGAEGQQGRATKTSGWGIPGGDVKTAQEKQEEENPIAKEK